MNIILSKCSGFNVSKWPEEWVREAELQTTLVLCSGPLYWTSCSCPLLWGPRVCIVGVFMADNLHRACVHQRAKDNLSLLMLLTHTDTQAHTHIFVPYLSVSVYVWLCVTVGVCEGSGGLGTVWKSHWASSGSSQSHGKQHWPKTTGIVQAAAWPPSIKLFRLDIIHQPLSQIKGRRMKHLRSKVPNIRIIYDTQIDKYKYNSHKLSRCRGRSGIWVEK